MHVNSFYELVFIIQMNLCLKIFSIIKRKLLVSMILLPEDVAHAAGVTKVARERVREGAVIERQHIKFYVNIFTH